KVVPEEEAIGDYVASAKRVGPLADYVVVNVSSPNTPGLRDLQASEKLRPLLGAVREALNEVSPARRVPLLVKIAPDLADEDVDSVAELALDLGLDGIIATNTTIRRDGLESNAAEVERCGAGGLSGPPVRERSLEVLKRLRAKVGDRLVLISVGGIETAEQAWERRAHSCQAAWPRASPSSRAGDSVGAYATRRLMSWASAFRLIPSGFRNSSMRISPG
ncbi:MAG: dihydroorotate dehydrogenase (quinone), partial [Deltaproteobacteria bacterium]|nr:dihydroorotate dehydrogenase (quinone) [Deltaproteobacteria bacterium]